SQAVKGDVAASCTAAILPQEGVVSFPQLDQPTPQEQPPSCNRHPRGWSDVMEKLEDYFAAGVAAVWVVDPRLRQVFPSLSLATIDGPTEGQALADPDFLPGFSLHLVDLFRGWVPPALPDFPETSLDG